MRFAWQMKHSTGNVKAKREVTHPRNLVMMAYNIVWWIPIILPFAGVIDYRTGFIAFFAVTVVRLIANLLRNNILQPQQAVSFPLRSP